MSTRGAIVAGLTVLGGFALLRSASTGGDQAPTADRVRETLDRVVERARARGGELLAELEAWPVAPEDLSSIGDDAKVVRSSGPHQGVDLRAPAGTPVLAPEPLRIIRVVNGTASPDEHKRRAGLWVDAEGRAGRILRFLHLGSGSVAVTAGDRLPTGGRIGQVADTGDSGNNSSAPHLHFEVRQPGTRGEAYGPPINPVEVLPNTGKPSVLRRLAQLRAGGQRGFT